jgi:hypothetical protein
MLRSVARRTCPPPTRPPPNALPSARCVARDRSGGRRRAKALVTGRDCTHERARGAPEGRPIAHRSGPGPASGEGSLEEPPTAALAIISGTPSARKTDELATRGTSRPCSACAPPVPGLTRPSAGDETAPRNRPRAAPVLEPSTDPGRPHPSPGVPPVTKRLRATAPAGRARPCSPDHRPRPGLTRPRHLAGTAGKAYPSRGPTRPGSPDPRRSTGDKRLRGTAAARRRHQVASLGSGSVPPMTFCSRSSANRSAS